MQEDHIQQEFCQLRVVVLQSTSQFVELINLPMEIDASLIVQELLLLIRENATILHAVALKFSPQFVELIDCLTKMNATPNVHKFLLFIMEDAYTKSVG